METTINRNGELPVFKQIYDILLAEMDEDFYRPVGKLPSERELCQRFDVERNTVRKALQMLVDERRIARVPGIGSRILSFPPPLEAPAQSAFLEKSKKQDGNIIILITQIDYLHSTTEESFHYKLIHSFEKHFSRLGYNLLFKPVGHDGIVTETIYNASPRGVIFDSFIPDSFYREARSFKLPCISINHYTPLFTSIVSNNFEGAYNLTKYFADAGHERIAFIMGKSGHQTNMERMNGVRALCAARDIPLKSEYLIPGDWTFASGVEAAKNILRMEERPTAVFAFNDDIAYGCYSVFQSCGLSVPGDISLAGFDKSDRYKDMFPPITTVDVNLSAIVDYACWYISSGISGWIPESSAKIEIDTALCDNGTVKSIA